MKFSVGRKGRCPIVLLERWQETTDREYVGKWDLKVLSGALIIKCSSRTSFTNQLCHLCGQKGETVTYVVCE